MSRPIAKLLGLLLRAERSPGSSFDGFVDSLLQKFENCRGGLHDEWLAGSDEAKKFVLDLYEPEIPRLREAIRQEEPHLDDAAREEIFTRVDGLMRSVLMPTYLRLALPFTKSERNGFYLLPESLHTLERILWGLGGLALGGLIVAAPFIPIWSKEIILPCGIAAFFLPNLRKIWRIRRYESELNEMVARAERELLRVDGAYVARTTALAAPPIPAAPPGETWSSPPPEDPQEIEERRRAATLDVSRQSEGS